MDGYDQFWSVIDGGTGGVMDRPYYEYTKGELRDKIARLQKEVERYEEQNRALLDEQIPCACGYDDPSDVCGKHHPAFKRKLDAAHNDAIEAAAELLSKAWDEAIQGDLEHGVKSLNERAAFIFSRDYPLTSRIHEVSDAIRALKK